MSIQHPPTLEEFLRWPEQKPYQEFLHGNVRPKAMPTDVHSFLQTQLAVRLSAWQGPDVGFTLTEQRCILKAEGEEHVVLPDVSWFWHEQLPELSGGPVRVPPTLAIEILSPDDRFGEVQDKVLLYLAAGVSLVWVLDPEARNVSVYRPGVAPQVLGATATLSDPLLPGLEIPLAALLAYVPKGSQPKLRD